MLHALINFLLNRKGHQQETAAPYKVEAPEPAKCGCGRSPTGFCVGHHKLTEAEWAAHPDNKSPQGNFPFPAPVGTEEKKPAVKAKAARTKKAPAAAMTAAEKPARKPRAKKAKE